MPLNVAGVKRIFYFNINYACNNRCIFCYSHNTVMSKKHDECLIPDIIHYLDSYEACEYDRIIINGGEPLLHSGFQKMILCLKKYRSEVLIYTNGRLLTGLSDEVSNQRLRFVIPIHGCEKVHDEVTQINGSFRDTIRGMSHLKNYNSCIVDVKIIINEKMIYDRSVFQRCVTSFDDLLFNGSVHIVKMAETKVSRQNCCKSVDNDQAALYTRLLFDYWRRKNKVIKMFDTCIKRIDVNCCGVTPYTAPIEVLFKDSHLEKDIRLGRIVSDECLNCTKRDICQSAVEDYKVLEYNNGKFYINLE